MQIQNFMKNCRQFYRENGKNITVVIQDKDGQSLNAKPVNGIYLLKNDDDSFNLILTTE